MTKPDIRPPICDYEGSNYRTEFWEGKGRDYEDLVERIALRKLLPKKGKRLLELGAGFGRLTNEYHMYDQIVLVDYSFSQLQYAQEKFGTSERFVYVAADAYQLPFRAGIFDGATIIRVIHHIADVNIALRQVRRVLAPDGKLILEYANKRNIKALYRYSRGLQKWDPNDLQPVEFVELNFDFHPTYMRQRLAGAGFSTQRSIPVSFFRLGAIKDHVPARLLAGMDGLLQLTGLHYTPSVFTSNTAVGASPDNRNTDSLFVAPGSGEELVREGDTFISKSTNRRWAIRNGIYDFKAPIDE